VTIASQLIDELQHNATASGNRPLERRLADLTAWHYNNTQALAKDNLAARQAFLERAFWIQLEVIALLVERLRETEGSKNLWLPAGLDVHGDLRSFR
jgi:hypothetical protein